MRSLRIQLALLAHVYRNELLEAAWLLGRWFSEVAQELALSARDIMYYGGRRHGSAAHRHRG